jgi:uroporphyrinogen decarboxylase
MTWTSRERVAVALNHQQPDRVPININPLLEPYLRLKAYLGMEIEEDLNPDHFMEVIPHPKILARLGADLISVRLGSPTKHRVSNMADSVIDEWGIGRRRVYQDSGSYLEAVHHPLAEATIDDLEKYSWPNPNLPGRGEGAAERAKWLFENTDLAIVGRFGGPINELALYLVGMERWLIRMKTDPEFAAALLDKITDIQITLDRIGLEATATYLTILKVSGEDLGTQNGPMYSPHTFRTLLLPRLRRRCQAARSYLDQVNPSVKILLHSCGSIRMYIPDLIDAGIQVIDPVQPLAAHMDSFALKNEFGDRLCFHGGIDIQQVLPFGSPGEIIAEVCRRIAAFAQGGGYILAPSHYIQADIPPQNVKLMCEAAINYGCYPLDLKSKELLWQS